MVQRWQDTLEVKLSYTLVMACRWLLNRSPHEFSLPYTVVMAGRSLLNRILQAAVDEQLIAANPVRRVRPPKRQVDPEAVFGRARGRAHAPQEVGPLPAP